MSAENNISFEMPKNQSSSIKVIGVGGGGSNAVNHMYSQQIHGVDFVICNTDQQALESSPIPNKVQLGAHLTSGLGAGANPEIGAQAAAESIQEIQQMLSSHTKMVFITAGMGGGTGTGAAPIIAKVAKDMDILVVGIVTMPFQFEGRMRSKQAQKGIDELRKNVDSLIVINNNKLREVYGNLGFKSGFSKADEVLSTAAKGIAEVITHHYKQNIDLHDAKTVLSNSGTAIMGSAKESGDNRAQNAIIKALDSPLLNDNKITGAKNVLLLIVSGNQEVTLDEIGEINDYIQEEAGYDANIIMGIGEDESLEEGLAVTIVATGFAVDQQHSITNTEVKKVVHTLEGNQKATYNFDEGTISKSSAIDEPLSKKKNEQRVVHNLGDSEEQLKNENSTELIEDKVELTDVSEDDFIITNVPNEIENQSEEKTQEPVQSLLFELPIIEEEDFVEEIEEPQDTSERKTYILDDFEEVQPTIKKSSQPNSNKEIEEELQFEVKTKKTIEVVEEDPSVEISPLDLTVSELKRRTTNRRTQMKKFNYKFTDTVNSNIEEIENQPAYKRSGVDLTVNSKISKEKTSLRKQDDEFNLSGNSFLHDNVD